MEKKKKKKKGNRAGGKLGRQIQKDVKFGERMNERFGINTPLERLDTSTPSAVQSLIDTAQSTFDSAGNRSQEMSDLVSTMQGGLGGLTAQENQAMRERAMQELTRQSQAAQRNLALSQAGSGVRGAAGQAGQFFLDRDRMNSQRNLEMDILLENIAVQDKRRDAFGNFLGGLERDEFGRVRDSFGDLTQLVSGNQARGDAISQFNIGQGEKERQIQQGGMLGWAGLLDARRQTNFANNLARDSLNKPQTTTVGGGGGGFDSAGYVNSLRDLIGTTYPTTTIPGVAGGSGGETGGGI